MEHFEEEERERQTDIRTRNRKEKKAFSKKKKEEQGVYPGFGFENFNIDFTDYPINRCNPSPAT
jgi:hypothetical protein